MTDPYAGIADQYDALHVDSTQTAALSGLVLKLLPRPVLSRDFLVNVTDLCCGTGLISDRFRKLGYLGTPVTWWNITGVDRSVAMLDIARDRLDKTILADATSTGLPDASSDLTLNTYAWTDVEDWAALVDEARRITAVGGYFVGAGLHPSFIGPHIDDSVTPWQLHAGYYRAGPAPHDAPGTGSFRRRVGWRHATLTHLLQPLLDPGWRMEALAEAHGDPPVLLGFRIRRTDERNDR